MKNYRLAVLVTAMGLWWSGVVEAAGPQAVEPGMTVQLFAEAPWVERPLAVAVDGSERLLLLDQRIDAPNEARLVVLHDKDGDGRCDHQDVLCEGLRGARAVVAAGDDGIHLLTSTELLRVKDADGDGLAETKEKALLVLEGGMADETVGFSGLAWVEPGWLVLGLNGGNAEGLKLRGRDGWVEDAGTAGSIWRVRPDGSGLRRMATGLARIGGVGGASLDQVYATDQDPPRHLPARVLQVVQDGQYGYREAYAGFQRHPFFAWKGERLGLLPPLSEVGDEPGGLEIYGARDAKAGDGWGLPAEWHGSVLVTSAGDHRIEALLPQTKAGGALPPVDKRLLLQGGREFRPVSVAARSDGAVVVADETDKKVAGKLWLCRRGQPGARTSSPRSAAPLTSLRETITDGPAPSSETMIDWLLQADPVVFHLAVRRLARDGRLARELAGGPFQAHPQVRAGVLLAVRIGSEHEGVPFERLAREVESCVLAALLDGSPEVALPALQWVAESGEPRFQSLLDTVLRDGAGSIEVLMAAVLAIEQTRQGGGPVSDPARLASLLEARLADRALPPEVRLKLLQARVLGIPQAPKVSLLQDLFTELLEPVEGEPEEQKKVAASREPGLVWLTHCIGLLDAPEKMTLLREMALNATLAPPVRSAALSHYRAVDADVGTLIDLARNASGGLRSAALCALTGLRLSLPQQQILQAMQNEPFGMAAQRVLGRPHHAPSRPQAADPVAWVRYLNHVSSEADPGRGREVFLSAQRGGCAACHVSEHLGQLAGVPLRPASAGNLTFWLSSILRPSAVLSPGAALFKLTTVEGQERLLCLTRRGPDASQYLDAKGELVEVRAAEVDRREAAPASIMPEGLLKALTDEEVRDLLAYLMLSTRQ